MNPGPFFFVLTLHVLAGVWAGCIKAGYQAGVRTAAESICLNYLSQSDMCSYNSSAGSLTQSVLQLIYIPMGKIRVVVYMMFMLHDFG